MPVKKCSFSGCKCEATMSTTQTEIFVVENGTHGYYAEVVVHPYTNSERVLHTTDNYPTRGEAFAAADAWEVSFNILCNR